MFFFLSKVVLVFRPAAQPGDFRAVRRARPGELRPAQGGLPADARRCAAARIGRVDDPRRPFARAAREPLRAPGSAACPCRRHHPAGRRAGGQCQPCARRLRDERRRRPLCRGHSLARRYPDAPIVVSGGLDTVLREPKATPTRAVASCRVRHPAGAAAARKQSRNTAENALFAKELASRNPARTGSSSPRPTTCRARRAVPQSRVPGGALACRLPHRGQRGLRHLARQRDQRARQDRRRPARMDRPHRLLKLTGKIDEPLPGPGSTASMPPAGPN